VSQHHLKETTRLGLAAAKANLLPSSLLWITGIALVALYYNHQPTARFLDEVGVVKMAWAPWFAMISTAVFGSVVPWLAQLLFAAPTDRQKLRHLPWLFLFWAAQGFQIDLLYKFQDRLFGSELTVQTIVSKALVDEFVWVPFLAIPQIVMAYLVIEKDFSRTAIREALQRRSFIARAIPLVPYHHFLCAISGCMKFTEGIRENRFKNSPHCCPSFPINLNEENRSKHRKKLFGKIK